MSRMTARTSIYNETDGISAPKIWLTRLFQTGTAACESRRQIIHGNGWVI